MKAVRAQPDGGVKLVEVPAPAIGPGDALLRTGVSGICGSDLLDWYVRGKAGTILGHEVAGEIVEVGSDVAAFRPGDRVVPHHHAPCLDCAECAAGRFVHCAGWRASRLDPGGMAELVRIPAGNLARDTLRIPRDLSEEEASFTEPLATVGRALARGGLEPGQSLLVVGLGTAGQLAVRLARELGAGLIGGADPAASRRTLALEGGADHAIDVSGETIGEAARRLSGGKGFDLVFVCPGKEDVIREAFDVAGAGGTLLLFTMSAPEERLTLSPHDLYFREIRIVPSYSCGPADTALALERIASGRVPVSDLVTHRFPIDRAEEAFGRAREPEGSMKVTITFG